MLGILQEHCQDAYKAPAKGFLKCFVPILFELLGPLYPLLSKTPREERFVPQVSRSDVQIGLSKAQHAQYAQAVFLSICVSFGNKGRPNQIPKLKVASSILVARSKI